MAKSAYIETGTKVPKMTRQLAIANTKEWSTSKLIYVIVHRHRFGLLMTIVIVQNIYLVLSSFDVI